MTEIWEGDRMVKSSGSSSKNSLEALVIAEVAPTKGAAKPAARMPPAVERSRKTSTRDRALTGLMGRREEEDMPPAYVEGGR